MPGPTPATSSRLWRACSASPWARCTHAAARCAGTTPAGAEWADPSSTSLASPAARRRSPRTASTSASCPRQSARAARPARESATESAPRPRTRAASPRRPAHISSEPTCASSITTRPGRWSRCTTGSSPRSRRVSCAIRSPSSVAPSRRATPSWANATLSRCASGASWSTGGQVCHRCENDVGGVRVPARQGERGEQHPLGRALDAQRHAHVGGVTGDPGQHPQHGLGVDRRRRGRLPGLGHRVPERLGPVPGAALGIGSRVRVHQGEVPDLPLAARAGAGERAVGTQLDDRVVPGREVRRCAELGVVRYRESH